MNPENLTISQIHQGLLKKEFSAQEIVRVYLDNIEEKDKDIGAFLEVRRDLALRQAKAVDGLIAGGGTISKLSGVPFGVKDAILVKDMKCTAASKILENYKAPYDATSVKKLKEEEAVCLGKTNLDEFTMGSSNEHSAFKATKNPHDLSRVPGGSSGGSAAAVASNECVFSLGSDTGGSIRQPANFCGVVGLKPTYGAVSRYGLIAHASSLDQIGPIAKTVEDCEVVFDVIKGRDEKDSTSVVLKPKTKNQKLKVNKVKIGVPKECFTEGIEPEVEKVIKETIKKAEREGVKIEEISLPHSKYALASYYIISTSEASANLARYDGIRYGLSKEGKDLIGGYFKTRGQGLGEEVKRRIIIGTFALSSGYYEAYYSRAQKVRTLVKKDFSDAFQKVDFILTPVSPFPAFKLGEKIDDPLKMYLSDIYTVPINLAGLPAISLPAGKAKGLPVGLQIVGEPFSEAGIFELAKVIEKLCQ